MAEYLSPGVYVEEFDSGIKAMEGVGTSTAGFVGMAQKGPVKGLPVLLTSMADYQRRFGGYLSERVYGDMRFLPYAVEQFFNNGGSTCYVMRVCGEAGSAKGILVGSDKENPLVEFSASNPGAWGNRLQAKLLSVLKNRMQVTEANREEMKMTVKDASGYQEGDIACLQTVATVEVNGKQETSVAFSYHFVKQAESGAVTLEGSVPESVENAEFYLYLLEWNVMVGDDTAAEQYEGTSLNPARSNYMEQVMDKSQLVTVRVQAEKVKEIGTLLGDAKEPVISITFEGGGDGEVKSSQSENAKLYIGEDGSPDQRTGLMAFKTLQDVSIMAIPGITDKSVQSALVSHCENAGNRFAVLDMPLDAKEVSAIQEFRENIDSSYAAMYHPWLLCYDPLANRNVYLPPSGSMAGIYGRTDNTRGVHKAPANEVVRNCTGLSVKYNEAEQGKLNPRGINLIRQLPGLGIRVWGARTCSSDGNWKYVNVRRLFIFIEESIKANTNWAVFEPNDEMLWSRVEGTIRVFLTTQWRNGALAGSTAEEAFFINIGKSTMTEDDILNGRLICVIGVAPVRPAEFVIFRITQKMESAQ